MQQQWGVEGWVLTGSGSNGSVGDIVVIEKRRDCGKAENAVGKADKCGKGR